jgi:hypothetical protein
MTMVVSLQQAEGNEKKYMVISLSCRNRKVKDMTMVVSFKTSERNDHYYYVVNFSFPSLPGTRHV